MPPRTVVAKTSDILWCSLTTSSKHDHRARRAERELRLREDVPNLERLVPISH